MIRRPPSSPLFPYTPLFRSVLTVVDTALGGITKAPAAADPQTAGLVLAAHFLSIPKAEVTKGWPVTLQIVPGGQAESIDAALLDRKSTRLNSSHGYISYAVF